MLRIPQPSVKVVAISSAIFVFTLFFGVILFKPILNQVVKSQKALKPGNEVRDFYLKLPIPMLFRVYFFNISNPLQVTQNGETPHLKEIGPYCYDAYKEKILVEENASKDTLTYTPYETYYFNKDCSRFLDQNDTVTILNPLIVGMINTILQTQPGAIKILNKALKSLFKENNGIYLTTRVRDILFEGIIVNCSSKDFAVGAVCSTLRTKPVFEEREPGILYFSLLGNKNGTIPKRVTVKRGVKNGKDVGRLVMIENATNLNTWKHKLCDEFKGTDGWVFPPIKNNEPVWSVSKELCRSIGAFYVEKTKFKGVPVKKYHANLGDMTKNPEESCFCPEPDQCLPKGIMDLSKCMDAPIYATLPHFLEVDEQIAKGVMGLQPELDKHIVKILFEPMTGTPMAAYKRVQFNLKIEPVEKVDIMKSVATCLHPFLWIEESIELRGFLLRKIKTIVILLKIFSVFKYITLLVSFSVAAYSGYMIFKDEATIKTVHAVEPLKPAENVQPDNAHDNNHY